MCDQAESNVRSVYKIWRSITKILDICDQWQKKSSFNDQALAFKDIKAERSLLVQRSSAIPRPQHRAEERGLILGLSTGMPTHLNPLTHQVTAQKLSVRTLALLYHNSSPHCNGIIPFHQPETIKFQTSRYVIHVNIFCFLPISKFIVTDSALLESRASSCRVVVVVWLARTGPKLH